MFKNQKFYKSDLKINSNTATFYFQKKSEAGLMKRIQWAPATNKIEGVSKKCVISKDTFFAL